MGLNYKILWVDDQFEELIDYGLKISIEKHLVDLGFEPSIEYFEDIAGAQLGIFSKKHDLILSDYNISEDGNGDLLIRQIREGKIYTEVLFYSAQSEFDAIAKSLYQDRVSFISISAQDGYDRLELKVKWLIDQTLAKFQEIESIRGLVMSETSHLDALVTEILITYFRSGGEHITKLRAGILAKIDESFKSNYRKNGDLKLASKTDEEIVQSRLFDASKMIRSVKDLIEYKQIDDHEFKDFLEGYQLNVITLRNNLAHAKSSMNENGEEYLIFSGKDVEEKIRFDHAKAVEIRKNLLKYRELLLRLQKIISAP